MPWDGTKPTPNNDEYRYSEDVFLVSKTDARGVLTYVNSAFIDSSGYSEEELIGSPHNMVRHPHMPKAAFKDLWETAQSGQEWRGFVKNLRKDGGFYWVDAMVTPSYKNGQLIGYMSVRRCPSREDVATHETLYHKMVSEEGGAR